MIRIKTDLDIDLIVEKFKQKYYKIVKEYGTNKQRTKSNRKRT